MYKAIKVRLYPNVEQTTQFNELLGCYRLVYNLCLDKKIESYKNDKTSENLSSLGKYFHSTLIKDEERPWLQNQNTKVLKQSIIDLLSAYSNFFKSKKGYPKFKSKHSSSTSCRFPLEAISKRNSYTDHKVSLTNIKAVKYACSEEFNDFLIRNKDYVKSATLTKNGSGEFHLSFLIDNHENMILVKNDNCIALDLGVKDFCVTSNNDVYKNPKFKKKASQNLKKLQRQLSKKKKGSNNRKKAKTKLAKASLKVTNQRSNYLHQVSTKIVNENQVIIIEDLDVKGMLKKRGLAESIQDVSFAKFRQMLTYKCEMYGRELVIIDRWFPSSKLCHNCGEKNNELTLSDREWTCGGCETTHDRDFNATLNIKKEGLRLKSLKT